MIQTLRAGDVVGWSWLFPPYHWHFDVWQSRAAVRLRSTAPAYETSATRTATSATCSCSGSRVVQEELRATQLQLLDVYGSAG